MSHKHWKFDSVCPKCGHATKVISPEGELVVRVHCDHCAHGYDYTHIVREHMELDNSSTESSIDDSVGVPYLETKVLIIGAGYGGMAAAVLLQKHHVPFTLVNKHDYHYFKTLLHEAAGGRADFQTYAIAIDDVLRRSDVTIIKDQITKINYVDHIVETETAGISYNTLIVGLGSQTAYFNIPGLKEHSLILNTLEDAKRIRKHIESVLISHEEEETGSAFTVVIGGGGLTGIEMMGELADYLPVFLMKNHISTDKLQLVLVHSHEDILPGIDSRLREVAKEKLLERDVKLILNERVVSAQPNKVVLSNGTAIETQTFIWTGGVLANPLLQSSGFTVDDRGRAMVNEELQSVDNEDVYIVGDCSHCLDEQGILLPTTGQVAEQMGQHAAKNIIHAQKGEKLEPFVFHFHGLAASLGPHEGVAEVGHVHASGVTALAMKEGSKAKYLMHLGGVHALVHKRRQWIRI